MWRRISWLILFLPTASLLFYFFTFPFARVIFIPGSALLAIVAFLSPPLGIGLFIATSLTTLQIPIVLELPFFFGPEPCFLAICAGISFRYLLTGRQLHTPRRLSLPLAFYGLAVAVSAGLVWISLFDLPDGWPLILSRDALSKIFFWRWENPFHFIRIGLLYFEGIAAFMIGIAACRHDARKTAAAVTASFLFAGVLLMGYSLVDLLLRGKEISVYPGFGPVFTDRNAYAAFWVLYTPLALVVALNGKGFLRIVASFLAVGSFLFCLISLSFAGIGGLLLAVLLAFLLTRPYWAASIFRTSFYRQHWSVLSVSAAAVILLAAMGWITIHRLDLTDPIREKIAIFQEKGILRGIFEERAVPWSVAAAMCLDRPLLGIGPGEYYRLYQGYRDRFTDLPEFEYQQENAHNYYLQLAGETGLLGVGSFLTFLLSILYWACRDFLSIGWTTGTGANADPPKRFRSWTSEPQTASASRLGPLRKLDNLTNRSLDHFAGLRIRSGFLAAIGGLVLVSIAQHPMLRLEFQVYFWLFCALLVTPQKRSKNPKTIPCWGAAITLLALMAGVTQWALFPLTDRNHFKYGFRPLVKLEHGSYWPTERVAFFRGLANGPISLRFKGAAKNSPQQVRVSINGIVHQIRLDSPEWQSVPVKLKASSRIDLGIESFPALPRPFVDSWGAGVQVAASGFKLK